MSKKTENIYRTIEALEDLQNQIAIINQMARNASETDEEELKQKAAHLENIEFEMQQQLKSLRFWIGSLYSYNGKSTSRAKQSASKENGKKGGRPPKKITEARRRIQLIEEELVPELEHSKKMTDDFDEENRLAIELEKLENERNLLKEEIQKWKK